VFYNLHSPLNFMMSGSGGDNTASTSTSTDLLSGEVRREIDAIFGWNPLHLYLTPPTLPHQKSTSKPTTRGPSFYDRHFSDDLILQHVKRLPSLVPDLASNVDHTLRAASATLPRTWNLPTAGQRDHALRFVDNVAEDEKAVVEAYMKTVPTFCEPVASTLALHPKASASGWSNLLTWSTSVRPSGYAIADGQLRIKFRRDIEEAARVLDSMDSDTRKIVEKIRDANVPLCTWEFKSIATGSDEVMKAVGTLGKFPWTGCDTKKCPKKKQQTWTERARQVVVGSDANDPPWNLNVCAFTPTLTDDADYSIEPIR